MSVPPSPQGLSAQLWASLQRAFPRRAEGATVRVVDCGGGSGSLAVPLAVAGAEVTVVDVSIDALGTLLRRATEAGVADRVTAVQGEAESLSSVLGATGFDAVLLHEVLEDVSDRGAVLAQAFDVLAPAGVVSIVAANPVAAVLGRALAGDVAGALALFRAGPDASGDASAARSLSDGLRADCQAVGFQVEQVDGLAVFSDLVPGVVLERPGVQSAVAELEAATASLSPYREIASRLHLIARRPAA